MMKSTGEMNILPLHSPGTPENDPGRGQILVVEDDEDLADLLKYNLEKEGYIVQVAHDGITGLALHESDGPDLILLDVMLPRMNGWEVCSRVRKNRDPELASTPIIMLTALKEDENKFKGLELGADLYVSKPYSIREIILLCRNFVGNRKQRHPSEGQASKKAGLLGESGIYQLLFHELRTQLVIIGGMSQRLCRNEATLDTKDRMYAETIRKSSRYLEKLSDNLRLLEKIASRNCPLPRDSFRVGDLVWEVEEVLSPLLIWKGIRLTTGIQPPDLMIHLNRKGLQVVLSTLLENSIKYCPNDATIALKISTVDRRVIITVQDNGPGISQQDLPQIFEKYYRGEKHLDEKPGTGLGLYFARSLTESMGGTISAESAPGSGATFVLYFDQSPATASQFGGEPAAANLPPHVSLTED